MKTDSETAAVIGGVSPGNDLPAFGLAMASVKTWELVVELAKKHHFDLERPGYALCVKAPAETGVDDDQHRQPLGDLMICVSTEGYTLGFSQVYGAGFEVHYSRNWVPVRAFNVHGCPFRNLASANREMYLLLSRFRSSEKALVINLFGLNNA